MRPVGARRSAGRGASAAVRLGGPAAVALALALGGGAAWAQAPKAGGAALPEGRAPIGRVDARAVGGWPEGREPFVDVGPRGSLGWPEGREPVGPPAPGRGWPAGRESIADLGAPLAGGWPEGREPLAFVDPEGVAGWPEGRDPPTHAPALAAPAAPGVFPAPPPARGDPEGARGLLADVGRVIAAEEAGEWFDDASRYRSAYLALLPSVCHATPAARAEAARLALEAWRSQGDARAIFRSNGRKMSSRVGRALTLERRYRALALAAAGAEADCPFWVVPEEGYPGRQTTRGRASLNAETGGLFQLRYGGERFSYGGGGGLRLLPGYRVSDGLSLLAGAELAGGALLETRRGASQVVLHYFPALPLVARVHDVAWHYDFEVAPVGLFQANDGNLSYGARLGFGVGVSALRTRWVIPWAGVAVAYEHYFESGGRPAAELVRGGLRIGFQWAL